MSLTATQLHFTKFYLAAFLRAPELGGLSYWSDEVLVQGKSLQAVGGIIFSLPVVTAIYPSSIADQDFVEAIYHNVFGRSSDAEGLAYWTAEIATLRAGFAAEGSSNAAYEARGQLTMNMIEAALGTMDGTDGKAYIENRLEVAEYAVEQQLAAGTDIPVNALLDIFNELNGSDAFGKVDADAASVAWGKCEAASFFDVSAPTQLAGIVSVADDVGASKGVVANGGTTDDTAPLLAGTLDAPLALCETLAVYRNGVLVGKAAVDGASWSFADKGLANGSYAYSVRVVDLAGNQGATSALYRINVNNDTTAPAAPSLSLASDSGSSNSDGITNNGQITVSGIESGASWQYSTDGGTIWTAGTGSSFTLGAGVYAAGAVQARQTDAAGNLGTAGSASAITVDTIVPTASIVVADNALTVGETSNVTITFSEAVTGLETIDFSVENGALSALATSDNITYSATLTPTANTEDTTNVITLADAAVTDAAGNATSGATASNNYTVDTTAPTLLSLVATSSALRSGKLTTDFAGSYDEGYSLIQQADGQLLVAGVAVEGGNTNFALARYNADGSLDTSFGGDGKLTTDFAGGNDHGFSLIQQADGTLLLAGDAGGDFALARYNLDGTLDSSFGGGDGKLTTDFAVSYNQEGFSLIQQADGKLLVVGAPSSDFTLARYNLDGTLDSSFGGGDGIVITDLGSYAQGISLIQQADGMFVLAGLGNTVQFTDYGTPDFALVRYTSEGVLDTNFGSNGIVITALSGRRDVIHDVIQALDGKLLVAGLASDGYNYNYNFALARYNTDGTLDTMFGGGDGIVTTDFAGYSDQGYSLIQQADGTLLLAGYAQEGGIYNFALARYTADGVLDTSFGGGDGKVTTDFAGNDDYGYSLIQQADGKLLLAGYAYEEYAYSYGVHLNFALARYNDDGSLDTSFGAERLSALSLTSNEDATAGLYTSANTLIGSTLSLSANVADTLEVSAQASVTQTNLRLTDAANNSSSGAAVALGTTGNDTISLSSAGYLFGFDGNDNLTGSTGADVLIGGSGRDTLNLGSDSAVDRVLFDANGMGYDTLNGLVQGAGGDVLDVAALNLGSLSFNASVFSANPGAATDISGQVVRLLDISGGQDITATSATAALNLALNSGEYANLDMQANRSALVLTAETSNPDINYLFRVDSTDTGSIGAVELIGVINSADIDLWTAGNFAF